MRAFDLVLRKLWSDAPRSQECCSGEFGPSKRRLRHGFKDRR
jgi:hypothetical protein